MFTEVGRRMFDTVRPSTKRWGIQVPSVSHRAGGYSRGTENALRDSSSRPDEAGERLGPLEDEAVELAQPERQKETE